MAKKKNRQARRAEQQNKPHPSVPTNDTPQNRRLQQMINSAFNRQETSLRGVCRSYSSSLSSFDYEGALLKRRKAATANLITSLKERLGDKYNSLSELFDVEKYIISLNSKPILPYDFIDTIANVGPAIVIWILDQIKLAGKLDDALALLPCDDEVLETTMLPAFWDTCHEREVLQSALAILKFRHLECSLSPNTSNPSCAILNEIETFRLTDEWNASGVHKQPVPTRIVYDKLINLIPKESIEKAVNNCSMLLWQWYEAVLQCRKILIDRRNSIEAKRDSLTEDFNQLMAQSSTTFDKRMKIPPELLARIQSQKSGIGENRNSNSLSLMKDSAISSLGTSIDLGKNLDSSSFMSRGFQLTINAMAEKATSYEQELEELDELEERFEIALTTYPMGGYVDFSEFGEEIEALLYSVSFPDPYEICFAIFYMLDQEDDLAWSYYSGVTILSQAAFSLPWAAHRPQSPESQENFAQLLNQPGKVKPADTPELPNFYQTFYPDHEWGPEYDKRINLSQIIYRLTGTVLPRNFQQSYSYLSELAKYGIRGKKATLPLLCAMTVANGAKDQSRIDWRYELGRYDDDDDVYDPFEFKKEVSPHEVSSLKEEVDRLRKALHAADKEVRDIRKELDAKDKLTETQRLELADLRSIVFNQENLQEEPELVEPQFSELFPYQVQQRTLVFGGHDSWTREIKPRLPDVRFIGKDALPDLNLIRNADIIWVQTNCISHKQYYRMMDVARTRNIPVRYFSFSSAMKCALQVMEQDQKPI